ncbi:hypothetical protein QYM36_018085 [Artemia franciscana]|uniref:Transmembrane protein n=1 Tax=Artemia franciscana TaxID=6661 RepID=A0AA88KUA4_ARTSF|nr:hypothetical protein QYM36_018085 [Artemia franciscana]
MAIHWLVFGDPFGDPLDPFGVSWMAIRVLVNFRKWCFLDGDPLVGVWRSIGSIWCFLDGDPGFSEFPKMVFLGWRSIGWCLAIHLAIHWIHLVFLGWRSGF